MAEVCNCTNYFLNDYKLEKYDYCLTTKQTDCIETIYLEIGFTNLFSSRCLEKCPLECNKKYHVIFLSGYKYPTQQYVDQVLSKNQKIIDSNSNLYDFTHDLVNNTVQFSVHYDSLSYLSLLSFVELVDLLFVLAYEFKKKLAMIDI